MTFLSGLLVGLFIGVLGGVMVVALCVVAGTSDRMSEAEQWRWTNGVRDE